MVIDHQSAIAAVKDFIVPTNQIVTFDQAEQRLSYRAGGILLALTFTDGKLDQPTIDDITFRVDRHNYLCSLIERSRRSAGLAS